MGESIYTTITVGGRAGARVLAALGELLADQFENVDDTDGRKVATGERNYGNADEVEEFCMDHDLPYVLTWCAGREFSAGGHAWRPGMTAAEEIDANEDGNPVMTLVDLRAAHANGATLMDVIAKLECGNPDNLPALELDPDAAEVVIWAAPYDAEKTPEALGYFTLAEAAAKLGIPAEEITKTLDDEGKLDTSAFHAEWEA